MQQTKLSEAQYCLISLHTLCKKATIHQVTTMLATLKMSYFHVITTC